MKGSAPRKISNWRFLVEIADMKWPLLNPYTAHLKRVICAATGVRSLLYSGDDLLSGRDVDIAKVPKDTGKTPRRKCLWLSSITIVKKSDVVCASTLRPDAGATLAS